MIAVEGHSSQLTVGVRQGKRRVPMKSRTPANAAGATLATLVLPLSPFAPEGQTRRRTCKSTV